MIKILVEKKRICGRLHFFTLEGQNFAYRSNRPWKNASSKNFSDPKPQLTARRPFVVQKWPFKALFAQIRLADTEPAATRSYRQIEAVPLVFVTIKKLNPAIAKKVILGPIYTHT